MEELYVKNSFCDLNVTLQEGKKANKDVLLMLGDYGYETVALNQEVTLAKKIQLKPPVPLENLIDAEPIPVSKRKEPLKILRRLTVILDDATLLHALSSPSLESYDLLAVRPTNEKTFQIACSTLNVDIVSVDLSERVPFTFKQAQIGQAIDRGLCLEICYSPAIRDSTARRNTLANALELVKITKGKNTLVSSQAEKAFDLRAPADVTNLCHLFGIPSPLCKATITSTCRAALLHAATRRKTAKGVVSSCTQVPDTSGMGALKRSGKEQNMSSAHSSGSRQGKTGKKRKRGSVETDSEPPTREQAVEH